MHIYMLIGLGSTSLLSRFIRGRTVFKWFDAKVQMPLLVTENRGRQRITTARFRRVNC